MKGLLKDFRKHERHKMRGPIQLFWTGPDGKVSEVAGNCLDVSVYGMLVETPSPIPANAKVTAKLQNSDIPGEAVVCRSKQYGPWFRIGLRFTAALLLAENVPNIEEPLLKGR